MKGFALGFALKQEVKGNLEIAYYRKFDLQYTRSMFLSNKITFTCILYDPQCINIYDLYPININTHLVISHCPPIIVCNKNSTRVSGQCVGTHGWVAGITSQGSGTSPQGPWHPTSIRRCSC